MNLFVVPGCRFDSSESKRTRVSGSRIDLGGAADLVLGATVLVLGADERFTSKISVSWSCR